MSRKYDEDFIEYLPQIRHAAYKVADKFGDTFVVDELVNEAWIRGRNSNRPNKSQFISRATWDMKDYVRSLFGRTDYSYKGKKIVTKKRPQFVTNFHDRHRDETDPYRHSNNIFDIPVYNENLLNLENKELIELILKTPSERQLKAIELYYFGEMQMKEAGGEMGISECSVSNNIKRGIGSCRRRLDFVDQVHDMQREFGIANKEFAR